MNFNDLTIFINIYETRSLNQSAISLGYAQSNLSVRLKNIETEMNTPLFIRTYNGLMPTIAGDKFYDYARLTLEEFERFKKNLNMQGRLVLTSELLLHYDIHKTQQLDLNQDQIIIKKTSDIVQESQLAFYHEIFSFTQLNHLRGVTEIQKTMQVSYLFDSQLIGDNFDCFYVNRDQSCPFRHKTLHDNSVGKHIVELDSFENIISAVERGKGLALLPDYFLDIKNLQKWDQKAGEISYYHYKQVN